VPTTRVDEAIERVGLTGRDKDRYRSYSSGMRQRLAIAAALLKSPEVLILDEPTNGLDPADIRDVREMVRELGSSGATVLLSSHVLAEVQQVCDSVSIISRGRLLSTGAVADLVGREPVGGFRVGVHDQDAALSRLTEAGIQARKESTHLYVEGVRDPAEITQLLAGHGIFVRELVADRPDLETVYLRLTGDQHSGGAS
jgi:ABC-2 type transport system ATP-binding protein